MHTLNRLIVVCAMLLVALPAAGVGLFAAVSGERLNMEEELQNAINTAAVGYRQRGGLQSTQAKAEETMRQYKQELASLRRRKRALRLKLGSILRQIDETEFQLGAPLTDTGAIAGLIDERTNELTSLVLAAYRWERRGDDSAALLLTQTPAERAVGEREMTRRRDEMVFSIRALSGALTLRGSFEEDYAELEALRAQADMAQAAYDDAATAKAQADAQLEQIKQITADVHADVLRLQASLARIDARLKSKAERALIEKGLMDPETARKKAASAVVRFLWPVYGPISAGFQDVDYKEHFGVPHQAVDIVVPQSTPVAASSDGVVFLVRDGGATGYTYVLIGHRDGYATLYGHLSATTVKAGEEVNAGQTIGLSGGKPGTRGAGPMTTGSHLHFEVLKDGVHVNPKTVLP